MDWHSIQHILETAAADVVIFLDCCFAASADMRSLDGKIEILAACGRESRTPDVGRWSFTNRLQEVLHDCRHKPLTITMLHAKLINLRAVSGEKGLKHTPVHSIMSSWERASIRLCPMMPGSTPPSLTDNDLSESTSNSDSSSAAKPPSSRAMIVVSFSPGSQDPSEWQNWLLTNLPSGIKGLKLEGIWGSHSGLALVSLPSAIWDLLPENSAYRHVGFVTTPNLIVNVETNETQSLDRRYKQLDKAPTVSDYDQPLSPSSTHNVRSLPQTT